MCNGVFVYTKRAALHNVSQQNSASLASVFILTGAECCGHTRRVGATSAAVYRHLPNTSFPSTGLKNIPCVPTTCSPAIIEEKFRKSWSSDALLKVCRHDHKSWGVLYFTFSIGTLLEDDFLRWLFQPELPHNTASSLFASRSKSQDNWEFQQCFRWAVFPSTSSSSIFLSGNRRGPHGSIHVFLVDVGKHEGRASSPEGYRLQHCTSICVRVSLKSVMQMRELICGSSKLCRYKNYILSSKCNNF